MRHSELIDRKTRHLAILLASSALILWAVHPLHGQSSTDSVGRRRILPLPALASAPETGLQYGATVLVVREPALRLATRPSSLLVYALRTTQQQTRVGVELEHWSLGSRGGKVTELTAGVLTDTRDNLFAPYHGHWIRMSYARSTESMLSDYSYGRLRLDARVYRTVSQGHALAAQLQMVGVDGDAPFDQLALSGGSDIMRGYAKGRYRDRIAMAAQGEYRTPIRHRVGGVLFAGAGIVRSGFGDLGWQHAVSHGRSWSAPAIGCAAAHACALGPWQGTRRRVGALHRL